MKKRPRQCWNTDGGTARKREENRAWILYHTAPAGCNGRLLQWH